LTFTLNRQEEGRTVDMKKETAKLNSHNASAQKKNVFILLLDGIKYEFPILIILLALFFSNRSDIATNDVYVNMHIFDYRIGFAPRLFIGSLMSLFTNYKSVAFMDRFMDIFCLISLVLFAFSAGRVIRKSSDSVRNAAIFLIILFLVVPYSRSILFPGAGSISLDRFLAVYTLIAIAVANKTGIKWAIPILLFMGLATYHGFAFTFMPAIVVLLIYEVTGNRHSKENIALCITSFVIITVFSAYFFLYSGISSFKNIEELLVYASDKTNLTQVNTGFDTKNILTAFLLGGSSDFLQNFRIPAGWDWTGFKGELISNLYLTPLIATFIMIWLKAIKTSVSKSEKFVFVLCMLAPLARVPMFFFSTYYARARAATIIVQFFLIFYFIYTGNQAVCQFVGKGAAFIKRHFILFLLAVLYFAVFVRVL
jgi:hypothetical protein